MSVASEYDKWLAGLQRLRIDVDGIAVELLCAAGDKPVTSR